MTMNPNSTVSWRVAPDAEKYRSSSHGEVTVASTATMRTTPKEAVSSRSTKSWPPSGCFIALVIWGMRMALSTPADSRMKMTLGRVLAAWKASRANDVPPATAVNRKVRTNPSTRDTMVPAAMTTLARRMEGSAGVAAVSPATPAAPPAAASTASDSSARSVTIGVVASPAGSSPAAREYPLAAWAVAVEPNSAPGRRPVRCG